MHKNALFFEKKRKNGKLPQRWGLRLPTLVDLRRLGAPPLDPQVVTPITCYSYFLEGVCSANVISYCQKGLKKLKNSNNVLFCRSFLTSNCAG